MTRVSVALLAYNASNDLPALLDGLLAQTRPPHEVIAFDDRSTDDTATLLDAFASRAPYPVIVRRNERRFGPIEGTEMALRAASGDLIAIHDQADVWKPEKLERFDAASEEGAALVFSDGDFEGSTLWIAAGFSPEGNVLEQLISHPSIAAGTIAFVAGLRALFLPIPHHVSLDMWLSVLGALAFRPTVLPERLIERRHGTVVAPTGGVFDAAQSKMRSADADLHRQRRRAQAAAYASILERIESGTSFGDPNPATRELKQRIVHLEARGKLPDKRMQRVPTVVRELRSGRYNRYSAGVLSALQDLAY